jgi:RNA methyltransferase, TrmH family
MYPSRHGTLDSARSSPPDSPPVITSRDNRWLKLFRAALQGSAPAKDGRIGIEGPHLVEEALRSGLKLDAVLVSPVGEKHRQRLWPGPSSNDPGGSDRPRFLRTTDSVFAAIAGTETPQGIAGLARPRNWAFEDLVRGDVPLVVVLSAVQDPGNVGTILRSSEAFGATGAVVIRGTAHPFAPKALRASAGSALRLPILSGPAAPVVMAQLRVSGLKIFAAALTSEQNIAPVLPAEADLRGPFALFIGNEGAGLLPEVIHSADCLLRVPLTREVESLNAAVAASVLLYEAARQRGTGGPG